MSGNEEWRPCPGFEGVYEVSCRGRVRRVLPDHRTRVGRFTTQTWVKDGLMVTLCHHGDRKHARVHRLVAEAFIGPANGRDVRFRNDDRRDPRLENLYYGTQRPGNTRGERNGLAKITDAQALQARALLREGRTVSAVARRFGMSRRAIRFLRDGEHWSHLPR